MPLNSDAFKKYLSIIDEEEKYPIESRLRYKYMFSQSMLDEVYKLKLKSKSYSVLPIQSEEGLPLHYMLTDTIKRNLLGSVDIIFESQIEELNQVENKDVINSFIYSEIENSLLIEGVHSSRKKILSVIEKDYTELEDENQIIIKNMYEAYQYILNHEISVDTIFEMYQLLSKGCLKEDEKLQKGNKYRHDHVGIINAQGVEVDKGVNHTELDRLMEELVKYIHQPKEEFEHLLAPYIIHYYMVYLHPYFDYNGRSSRVLAFWYSLKHIPSVALLITSQAINHPKNKKYYYKAIEYARETNNDITYFIEYLSLIGFETVSKYIDYYHIVHQLEGNAIVLTNAEDKTLRTIVFMDLEGDGFFTWKKYELYDYEKYKKQFILRLLNQLYEKKILKRKVVKGAYLFRLDRKKFNI